MESTREQCNIPSGQLVSLDTKRVLTDIRNARLQGGPVLDSTVLHTQAALELLHSIASLSETAQGDLCCIEQLGIHTRATPGLKAFASEVIRLRTTIANEHSRLWERLLHIIKTIRDTADRLLCNAATPDAATAHLAGLRADLDTLGGELIAFDGFIRHNIASIGELGCDVVDAYSTSNRVGGVDHSVDAHDSNAAAYIAVAEAALLQSKTLEPTLVGLSDAYDLLRLTESDAATAAAVASGRAPRRPTWTAPQRFTRVTRKFWLLPQDVTRFKCEVIKHLPILIYGDREKVTEWDWSKLATSTPRAPPSNLKDSSAIASVYLDSLPDLPSYHARLRRDDMATAVRLRWYGSREPGDPNQQIFVERKVHREPYTNEFSVKERAALAQSDVNAFLEGKNMQCIASLPPEEAQFLQQVQAQVNMAAQGPLLKTSYRRTAFQRNTDNLIRVSLDTNLAMVREAGRVQKLPGDWCRQDLDAPDAPSPRPSDIAHFPYAVVEVKLQEKPPEWLKALVQCGVLLAVPKFSKFLHGTAVLYQRCCENVPHWFLPDETDPHLSTPATWEELADPDDPYQKNAAEWLFPSAEGMDGVEPLPEPQRPERRRATGMVLRGWLSRGRGGQMTNITSADKQNADLEFVKPSSCDACPSPQGGSPRSWKQVFPASQQLHTTPELQYITIHPSGNTVAVHQRAPTGNSTDETETACGSHSPKSQGSGSSKEILTASAGTPSGSERLGATGRSTPQDERDVVARATAQGAPHSSNVMPRQHLAIAIPAQSATIQHRISAAPAPLSYAVSQYSLPNGYSNGTLHDLEQGNSLQSYDPKNDNKDDDNYSSSGLLVSKSGRAKRLVRTRVEPKTFFANERTFLQWLNISVLVMFLALSLLSGSSIVPGMSGGGGGATSPCSPDDRGCFAAKVSGALIAPVALAFMAYALFMYKKRTIQILKRETVRYDDQRGPVVLVLVLLVVLLIAYVIAMIYVF